MLTVICLIASLPKSDPLAEGFRNPPLWARPHTWWHWMNGMVTKEGITADLEAMKKVGIGGAQMFAVDQGIPAGPAKYDGPVWRDLTQFAVKEAARLGLELCIHNGAGWSSSGGPWITPANGMQVVAWSSVKVQGPTHFDDVLPTAKAPHVEADVPYYRDIAVYAYRTPEHGDEVTPRPGNFLGKTGVERNDGIEPDLSPLTSCDPIPASGLVMLTEKLGADGRLTWDVPDGNWTILRVGHVPTGITNHPAPPEGTGLEVDKLSRAALDTHWAGMMAKVVADAGPLAGKSLNNVLIDSYEVGSQNWTPMMRQEFMKRRGYDPLPYLPVIAGRIVNSKPESERFLWDLRRTIADLYADNYYGYMAELCHRNGLKFSAEPYGNGGFDNMASGARADIPMAEFWLGGGAMETTKMVSSLAHVYGRPIVGAESFTGDDVRGRWLEEPYRFKATGDLAFCNGINRYIFHRWAMQPWLDKNPGMTMGPWGTHFERTQTWFTEAETWLKYVQRCQYLLQQGQFVADICYYYGENSPCDLPYRDGLNPKPPEGYDYDGCDTTTLMRMSVKDGKLVLPSGMSYRLLVLPNSKFMRPEVLRKIAGLVKDGAQIYGGKPSLSPSLQGYPTCDTKVQALAEQLWGAQSSAKSSVRQVGSGRVYSGATSLGDILKGIGVKPDFGYATNDQTVKLANIHRRLSGADAYFISNQNYRPAEALGYFNSQGREPEFFHPDTGKIEPAPAYYFQNGLTVVPLDLTPAESVFVLFRHAPRSPHLQGEPTNLAPVGGAPPRVTIDRARYETDDGRGADVTAKVRAIVAEGYFEVVAGNSVFGDPVVNVRKHLVIDAHINGKPTKFTADENESVFLIPGAAKEYKAHAYDLTRGPGGRLQLAPWGPIDFGIDRAGMMSERQIKERPLAISLDSNWDVTFPPKLGAPASADFPELISWPESSEFGIKYFSGSATYHKTVNVPAAFLAAGRAVRLDLGKVKNFATVTINGKEAAVLWKPPFCLDVRRFLRPGANTIQIKVTNLWVNRIIGDEHLPPDVEWQDGHLAKWPDWMVNHQPRPKTGRVTFETWHFWDKNSPLLESGLLGPVKLESARIVSLGK